MQTNKVQMRAKEAVLLDVNRELPPLDWRTGAQDYLAQFFQQHSRNQIEAFVFTKPLGAITPEDPAGSLTEAVSYLFNFASSIKLLKLERGARILDVACGGGWFAHWLRKLGYDARGMDLSADFIDLARRRLADDPYLSCTPEELEASFRVHDFEAERLPEDMRGIFDAIVLESCLHHFFDPIAAMTHIAEGLAPGGVILVLEGENRQGPIHPDYMKVMLETSTLERPYPRPILREVLEHAGLPHIEFLGTTPGFFPESAPIAAHMTQSLADNTRASNMCVCGRDLASVQRVAPSHGQVPEPEATAETAAPPPTPQPPPQPQSRLAQRVRDRAPDWSRPVLRTVWRAGRRLWPRPSL